MATKTVPPMSNNNNNNNNNNNSRRTHRACDRCRVKKSKCNGQQPCNTCNANERTCVFSALRRRDIRKWHCRMQDTIDEAIQRLYRACRDSGSFPGLLPDEKEGFVTTESILQCMGFTNLDLGPSNGNPVFAEAIQHSPLPSHLISGPLSRNLPYRQHHLFDEHNHPAASVGTPVAQTCPEPMGSSGSMLGMKMSHHHPLTPPTDPNEHLDGPAGRLVPNNDFVYTAADHSQPRSTTGFVPQTHLVHGTEATSMPGIQSRPMSLAWPYHVAQQSDTTEYDSHLHPYYMQEVPGWFSSHNLVRTTRE